LHLGREIDLIFESYVEKNSIHCLLQLSTYSVVNIIHWACISMVILTTSLYVSVTKHHKCVVCGTHELKCP